MNMHNPAHPGELLTGRLADLDATMTAFAAYIGISRVMLSRVLHGHVAVAADMDLRLSEALGTSPGYWLALQAQRDLWTARKTVKERRRVKRMAVPELEPAWKKMISRHFGPSPEDARRASRSVTRYNRA